MRARGQGQGIWGLPNRYGLTPALGIQKGPWVRDAFKSLIRLAICRIAETVGSHHFVIFV
jgi:hypothetical protein